MQDTIMEQDLNTQAAASETAAAPAQEAAPLSEPGRGGHLKKKKRRKKGPIIAIVIVAALVIGLILWLALRPEKAPDVEIIDAMVSRGSITSVIEGNGIVKAKNSETISVGTSGTVRDVYVNEGDYVTAGTVLFDIESSAADDAVKEAQQEVDGYQKQLKSLNEARDNLSIKAEFSGKLLGYTKLKAGDAVTTGNVIARLVDDSKMKLTQYYSYAYEGSVYEGQEVTVSVPSVMQQVGGKVLKVTKVERISPEGSRLFCVEIIMDNPGTLSEAQEASAIIYANGEQVSPYEQGKLEYNRSTEVKAKVSGEVITTNMQDYLKVSAGEELMRLSGEDNENEIFSAQESLKTAQESLDSAKKNQGNLRAVAPFDGQVIGLSIAPGDELAANTTVVTISDTSQMSIEINIDERYISFVSVGTMVEFQTYTQAGETMIMGTVDSLSLAGKFENGMATFPAKVLVDNAEGTLYESSGITYRIQASQSDDCLMVPVQCVKSVSDPETGESVNVVFLKTAEAPEGSLEVDGVSLGVPAKGYFAVPVTIGISDSYNVEIKEGLEEGVEVYSQSIHNYNYGFF